MTSGVSWNESGLSSELEQAAREAARRSGLSLDDWMQQVKGAPKATAATPALGASVPDATPTGMVRGARLADTVAKLQRAP